MTAMPPIGSTTRWRKPRTPPSTCSSRCGSRPNTRPPPSAPRWSKRPMPTDSTSRWRRGIGATTPRRCGRRNTISMRAPCAKAVFRARQHGGGGVRHRGAAVRAQLRARADCRSTIDVRAYEVRDASGKGGRPFRARQFRPPPQAVRRLDVELPRPGEPRRRGAADRSSTTTISRGDPTLLSSTTRTLFTSSATDCTGC